MPLDLPGKVQQYLYPPPPPPTHTHTAKVKGSRDNDVSSLQFSMIYGGVVSCHRRWWNISENHQVSNNSWYIICQVANTSLYELRSQCWRYGGVTADWRYAALVSCLELTTFNLGIPRWPGWPGQAPSSGRPGVMSHEPTANRTTSLSLSKTLVFCYT